MAASSTGEAVFVPPPPTIAVPRPTVLERARNHPYVRLAIDSSFSALWVGQLISIFGDRVHQIAIGALVLGLTGSYFALALVFVAATIPNLFLAPIAGTYVDRWDPRQVMIVSDLLRAAVVVLIPVAAVIWIPLIYPMVILMTSISVFFRPARVTALPRMVRESDILPANSALWVGETLGDVIGYPIAGLFVFALGAGLPLAFWFDAATYVASGLLIATTTMRTLPRRRDAGEPSPAILDDLRIGWRFLRREPVLLANTIQGAIGQFGTGIFTAVTYAYAVAITMDPDRGKTAFAAIETGIGVGNLVGGFLLGLVAARMARGKLVIVGYTMWGIALVIMGLTASVPFAVGLAFASGVANMIYIIPSQTMFQERVPPELLGRVVGFRFAAVFGSLTIAGAIGGIVAQVVSPSAAVLLAGILPLAAGLGGLLRAPCERPDATLSPALPARSWDWGVVLREWITRMTDREPTADDTGAPVDADAEGAEAVEADEVEAGEGEADAEEGDADADETPTEVIPPASAAAAAAAAASAPAVLLADLGDRLRPHVRPPQRSHRRSMRSTSTTGSPRST